MSLADVLTELYGLPPGEFTAARNAAAAQAKKDGDGDLADAVKKLPRPSVGAWLVNQLTRHRPDDVHEVLVLGGRLQRAQDDLDGDELRRLATERNKLVAQVLRTAKGLGKELGQSVSDTVAGEVDQTLRAALSDPEAGAALASGRLVKGLAASGFSEVDLDGQVAALDRLPLDPVEVELPPAGPRKAKPAAREPEPASTGRPKLSVVPDEDTGAARRELQAAEKRAREAHEAVTALEDGIAGTKAEIDEITQQQEELVRRLAELRDRMRDLETQAWQARKDAKDADRAERRLKLR